MRGESRYYDPSLGRYISADPIGLAGGINLYAYAIPNLINYLDPNGLSSFATYLSVTPILGTIYNAASTRPGASVNDYTILEVNCDDPTSVVRCKQDVARQAAIYAGDNNSTHTGHAFNDAVAALLGGSVGRIIAGGATGGVIGAGIFLLDGAIDTGVGFYKINKIKEAAQKAAKLCDKKCCEK